MSVKRWHYIKRLLCSDKRYCLMHMKAAILPRTLQNESFLDIVASLTLSLFSCVWYNVVFVPSFHFKLHCLALFVPFFLHNHITEIGNSLFLAFTQSIVYFLNAPFSCHNVTFCCHCLYWCSCNTFNFVKLSVLILNPGAKSLIRVGRVVLTVQGHGRRLAWGLL